MTNEAPSYDTLVEIGKMFFKKILCVSNKVQNIPESVESVSPELVEETYKNCRSKIILVSHTYSSVIGYYLDNTVAYYSDTFYYFAPKLSGQFNLYKLNKNNNGYVLEEGEEEDDVAKYCIYTYYKYDEIVCRLSKNLIITDYVKFDEDSVFDVIKVTNVDMNDHYSYYIGLLQYCRSTNAMPVVYAGKTGLLMNAESSSLYELSFKQGGMTETKKQTFSIDITTGINYSMFVSSKHMDSKSINTFILEKISGAVFEKALPVSITLNGILYDGSYIDGNQYVYRTTLALIDSDYFYLKFPVFSEIDSEQGTVLRANKCDDGLFTYSIEISGDGLKVRYYVVNANKKTEEKKYELLIGERYTMSEDNIKITNPTSDDVYPYLIDPLPISNDKGDGSEVTIHAPVLCVMKTPSFTFSDSYDSKPDKLQAPDGFKVNDSELTWTDVFELLGKGNNLYLYFLVSFKNHENNPETVSGYNLFCVRRISGAYTVFWTKEGSNNTTEFGVTCITTDENIMLIDNNTNVCLHKSESSSCIDFTRMCKIETIGVPCSAISNNRLQGMNSYDCEPYFCFVENDDEPEVDDYNNFLTIFIGNTPIIYNDDASHDVFGSYKTKVENYITTKEGDGKTMSLDDIQEDLSNLKNVYLLVFIAYRYTYASDEASNTIVHYYKTLLNYVPGENTGDGDGEGDGDDTTEIFNCVYKIFVEENEDGFCYECRMEDFIKLTTEGDKKILSIGGDVDLDTTNTISISNLSVGYKEGTNNDLNDYMDDNGCNRNGCFYLRKDNTTNEYINEFLPIDYIENNEVDLENITIEKINLKCYVIRK